MDVWQQKKKKQSNEKEKKIIHHSKNNIIAMHIITIRRLIYFDWYWISDNQSIENYDHGPIS